MDLSDILQKDRRVFGRDEYTCVVCDSEGDYDSLWAASLSDGQTRETVCTDCIQAVIERIFGEKRRDDTDSRTLPDDNVGLQAERYLDETFASFFRWLFRLPLRATILVVKLFLLPFYAIWLYLEKTGSIEAFREGYERSTADDRDR